MYIINDSIEFFTPLTVPLSSSHHLRTLPFTTPTRTIYSLCGEKLGTVRVGAPRSDMALL
jgi:hypothetical protein